MISIDGGYLVFHDRFDAGWQLAAHPDLRKIKSLPAKEKNSYIVISIPRGGTVVGDVIARQLNLTHDLVFSKRMPLPERPEITIGAVSEFGDVTWNNNARRLNVINKPQILHSKVQQIHESKRRKQKYRGQRKPLESLSGKTVILVDDGLATGATMKSAVMTCQRFSAESIIVAVPCGAADCIKDIRGIVDKVICLSVPYNFDSIGQCYIFFPEMIDQEVIAIMAKYQDVKNGKIPNSPYLAIQSSSS
ncbi:unnamed protein product [Rotaria sordida]|uniref:Phosphoribosyltransferase domain-containing protein n=1 Tax=Rotaria sordida TaxID=392033 RepID=A0A819PQR2_9BILA|nr:unnamed protein product [Rotaria sordida]CAF1480549.1 unnamed protein product [Rotaria sordida]CAF1525932.1 unnamed protein product [Rotaria sordida]CAF1647958.1 unnamed protein product [Rotaria sordida]CAF4014753.1 unnamed protein product [Rotaria sordida]